MDLQELKENLFRLSADCSREEWVDIASCFKSAGGKFGTFDDWSKTATRPNLYDAQGCYSTWHSITPSGNPDGAAGQLRKLAKESGFLPPPKPPNRGKAFDWDDAVPGDSDRTPPAPPSTEPAKVVKVYEYRDQAGRLLALNLRQEPKGFRPRYAMIENPNPAAYDDRNQWATTKPNGFSMPLYHEDEIAKRPGEPVYLCEGEKDADNLVQLGYLASCHKAGGGAIDSGRGLLAGRQVVIVGDNDESGRKYAQKALDNLKMEAASIAIIYPSNGKDFTDWMERQGTSEPEELRKRFERWVTSEADQADTFETLADTLNDPPPRAPELIAGLLRQGHKMIISGPPKAGKSFLMLQLAAALCEGKAWLRTFSCQKSKILYLNLEVDRPSMIHRTLKVYHALNWTPQEANNFGFEHLRGKSADLEGMAENIIAKARKHNIGAIFIDPVYKCGLADENAAKDIAQFCRILDRIATETGAAVIYCHHFSKGDQSNKSAIDRASGSGVFARDPDAILALSELTKPDCYRLEWVLREFKSPPPCSLSFEYPIHIPTPELDACPLKGTRGQKLAEANLEAVAKARQKHEEQDAMLEKVVEFARKQKGTIPKTAFISALEGKLHISRDKARALVETSLLDGRLVSAAGPKNRTTITAPTITEEQELL